MEISSLQRDADHFKSFLYVTQDDRLVTKQKFTICFPALYENHELATISDEVMLLGFFALLQGNKYCVNKVMAFMPLTPSDIYRDKINDEEYIFLDFDEGATVCRNINLMKEDTLVYYCYEYFISTGRIPWFLDYFDVVDLFGTSTKHTGVTLGETSSIIEAICCTIARNPKEGRMMFRTGMKSLEEMRKTTPLWVALSNIQFGAADTTSKLLGAYFNDGLNSAIAYKTKKVDPVEEVLRS